jgi:hypothetical protein
MRLGELSARGVPGQFVAFDGKAPLWRSVHTEQPMRERQVRGPNWRQALQVKCRREGCEYANEELMPVSIIRKFRGLYNTGKSQPDPQGLASRFDFIRPRTDDRVRYTTAECVIRDKGSLDDFIDRVPRTKMQHVPRPEPNDDPILQRPEIDFGNYMLLAIVSHDPNRFVELDIERVELMSGTMRVLCHYSEPGPVGEKIVSYGCYCAVIVRRVDGEVVFTRQ